MSRLDMLREIRATRAANLQEMLDDLPGTAQALAPIIGFFPTATEVQTEIEARLRYLNNLDLPDELERQVLDAIEDKP